MEPSQEPKQSEPEPPEESKRIALVPTGNYFRPTAQQAEQSHKFWDSQPMPKLATLLRGPLEDSSAGPLDPLKTVEEVRQTPYNLPAGFEWLDVDINDDTWAQEVYTLLAQNYVEDDDSMFRFDYQIPFLRWALTPEGFFRDWHVGVRVAGKNKLVGFITGIPFSVVVYGVRMTMCEINFLCVHKTLRTKRLAPVLIKEVTRRVNMRNIWQAVYTAGVVLPSPVAQCRYWHRSLNPVKLVEIGFSRRNERLNNTRLTKLYKLPAEPLIPGVRAMTRKDVPIVHQLLTNYLEHLSLHPEFTQAEVAHFFLPQDNVIYSYVVVDPESKEVTDFFSFYSLPSSVLMSAKYPTLNAAYAFYVVPNRFPLVAIFKDMLILAKKHGFDVFNTLDLMENATIFGDLRFGQGDGNLQYYLYNWSCKAMTQEKVGLILV